MEFQILGPLRVVEGGRDLTPARPKQRALLAMLLLHREEVVPGAQLIDAVWGEAPPETAQTALHGHVSTLRKLLGSDRIRTRPPGYLLHVSPGELDLDRFESLLAEARQRDTAEARAAGLREALALWRGEPLADLRYEPFAQREVARLEELRLGALEDRIDADLALGRDHELVAELDPLVAEHPFRERLRAQLMLALYRCGRQADALHVFQGGRKALVEELGIEPGPALQQLERQILNQDPALVPQTHGAVAAPEPNEERKVATVLMADVIGERRDPERIRAALRSCAESMAEVIASWGGTLEQYVGDTIVGVFGVPAAHEDDPERAIRAALELRERVESIRIGIDTGEVIAPLRGAPGEHLVIGDVVGAAARLQQAAHPGSVVVGERAYVNARRSFRFAEPFTVGSATARPVRDALPAAAPRLQAPLVGRERELDRLTGLLEDAIAAVAPRMALVYGPAGIGKSRLAREFLTAARERSDLTVLVGRCPATGRGMAYWALAEILRQAFGISLDDPAEVAAERLLTGARATLASLELPDTELERTVVALATTAGIPLPDNPLDELEPRLVADELARAWPRFATALALRRPTVVVVEDLHWAGEPLVEMLERLVDRCDGPLLLVATARPEFVEARPGLVAGGEGVTSISLQSLTEGEGAALVDALLESVELPGALRSEIVRTGEGNPFFLEEIALHVRESGRVIVPDSVHGVLASRLDALSAHDKRVLQEAAVVGRRFWREPLGRRLGDSAVGDALLRLEARGFVAARPTSSLAGQTEYQFKHALIHDVAHAGLPKARRARAHAEHAAWLEELAGDRRDDLTELIAAHYRAALTDEDADLAWGDDPAGRETPRKRGFEALLAAGDAARHRFAIDRALELHEEARRLAANGAERGKALVAIGDDHEAAYHGDEAFEAYLPALELLRHAPGTEALRAHACLMACRMAAVKWGGFRSKPTPDLWDELVDEGLAIATDDETRAWLTVLKGNVAVRRMKLRVDDPLTLDERLRIAEAGVDAAERLDRPALLSQSYRTSGLLQSLTGNWDRTLEIARRDIRLVDRLDAGEQAFALFWNALFFMEIAGEFEQSLAYGERSLEVARSLTPHERMHGTYTVMHARYDLGLWTELELLAGEHVDALAKEPGIGCPYARAGQLFAALALAHQGRLERAAELAATFTPDLDKPALSEALLARYLVACGDAEAGRELAASIVGRPVYAEENAFEILAMLEALAALEDWDALVAFLPVARRFTDALALVVPTADRAEGLARAAGGDRAHAEELVRRALSGFAERGLAFEAARTQEALAGVVAGEEASRLRAEALSTYGRLGATPQLLHTST